MLGKNQNEDFESKAVEEMEEKTKNRDRKKRKRMPISGKNVFKLRELRIKNQELGEHDGSNAPNS